MMADDGAVQREATELVRTLIRNACVNDGTVGSGHEDRNADAIEDYLSDTGLGFERYAGAPGRVSLMTRIEGRDRSAPTLLLMGHTDVVPVNPSSWQRDPFGAELDDGIIWGRGAVDMLNITATMAVALRRLARSGFRPRGTLVYLAAADEEAFGTYGVGYLMAHHADALRADYVITESGGVPVPTPSGALLPLSVGEKGVNWRRVIVRGTPGHGSRPFRTDNAVVTAAEVVRRIAAYQPKASILDVWRGYLSALGLPAETTAALSDPDRVLEAARRMDNLAFARLAHACTHTTFSANMVRGGVKVNVVPDRVEIDVDIRSLPDVTPSEVDAMLAEALGDLHDRVDIEAPFAEPGSISASETPLAASLARVTAALVPGSRIVPRLMVASTDGRYFRWKGVPAYGFGLHSPRIADTEYATMFHGNNERVDVDSLRLSALMWEALCRDFLG
jgi:acetylornithine deacetylase/succinyl-diaminopimelate desuccinylase-like protein